MGSDMRVFGLIRGRPGGRQVHLVVGFIRASPGVRCRYALGAVGFIPAGPGCHRVHSCSLGSYGRALGVIRVLWEHSGSP